ncbi:hypothetical protein ROHU_016274 [Labeo rohita]|uniref:Uncharacterized protein n=1 Tax=Labeo rohita TaxID=84645 RepID=A0A498NK58_LABRO|nr:hypothetical protein ROHU_016274 [Labeo rohita]
MRASRVKKMILDVKKPTVILPQLRVQLPEAAITSIPPLPSEPPPHRYRGGPKNRQNDPLPPNRHPFGRVAAIVSRKRSSCRRSTIPPQHICLSFHSPANERGRSVFKRPARPTATPMSSSTCNRDNRLSVLRSSPP